MKSLIIYDSQYKNTEKVAQVILNVLPSPATIIKVDKVSLKDLENLDLLIIGSPTWGGRPTPALQKFLNQISPGSLKKIKVASFDTRFLETKLNFALKLLVKTIGFAAVKIAKTMEIKGGRLIIMPEGFIVEGKEGPLAAGEIDRAEKWARQILQSV